MTPEQAKLYAQCLSLPPDDWYPFIQAHGLNDWEFVQFKEARKGGRGHHRVKQREKETVLAKQKGLCAFCEKELNQFVRCTMDRITGTVICSDCQLGLAHTRKMVSNGITFDRIAKFVKLPATVAPIIPTQVDSFDPLDPNAPDL